MEKTFAALMIAVFLVFGMCFTSEVLANPCNGVVCDDGDPCTDGSCDEATGQCVYVDNGQCVDPCEGVVCDDKDPCTDGSCDEATGQCVYVDNGTCEECPPADPKTQGYWKRQCKALRGIPHNRLKLHEEWMRGYAWVDDPCDALLAKAQGDMCAKAMKQITALELNHMTERVADCNCVMGGGSIGEAILQLHDLDPDVDLTCKEKNDLAEGINSGDWLVPCFVD